jgi:tetratricopeptide (TPR) repeat protein
MSFLKHYRFLEKCFSELKFYKQLFLIAALAFFTPFLTFAAADFDDSSSSDSVISSGEINEIRDMIDDGATQKAIDRLNKLADNDDENADVWNLLGYAYRNQGQNELSAEAYITALELDPEHKGALEYQGELFLTLGDIEGAKKNLKMLQNLCPTGCHELDDLQEALEASR